MQTELYEEILIFIILVFIIALILLSILIKEMSDKYKIKEYNNRVKQKYIRADDDLYTSDDIINYNKQYLTSIKNIDLMIQLARYIGDGRVADLLSDLKTKRERALSLIISIHEPDDPYKENSFNAHMSDLNKIDQLYEQIIERFYIQNKISLNLLLKK